MEDGMALGYALGQDSNSGNSGSSMWGGDNWIFAFLIIALIFGGRNGFGFGGFGGGGSADTAGLVTRADLCSSFNFNNLDSAVRGVQTGLCDGFYAVNTGLLNGFAGVNNAICDLGYSIQQGFNSSNLAMMQGFNGVQAGQNAIGNQIANCCCETQRLLERGFCDVGYALATNTNNIVQSQHNDTDRVIAKLDQMEATRQAEKIAALQNENQTLKFAASQAQQNGVIRAAIDASTAEILRRSGHDCPSAAYLVQPPTPVNFPINGCGTVQFGGNGYSCGGCGCCA